MIHSFTGYLTERCRACDYWIEKDIFVRCGSYEYAYGCVKEAPEIECPYLRSLVKRHTSRIILSYFCSKTPTEKTPYICISEIRNGVRTEVIK